MKFHGSQSHFHALHKECRAALLALGKRPSLALEGVFPGSRWVAWANFMRTPYDGNSASMMRPAIETQFVSLPGFEPKNLDTWHHVTSLKHWKIKIQIFHPAGFALQAICSSFPGWWSEDPQCEVVDHDKLAQSPFCIRCPWQTWCRCPPSWKSCPAGTCSWCSVETSNGSIVFTF